MNDAAATALCRSAVPLDGGTRLGGDLQAIVAAGLIVREGALLFARFVQQNPVSPGGVARAIERMGWRTLTAYECQRNSFHLEDESMQTGELNEDGVPRISEPDQVTLLRRGLVIAWQVSSLAREMVTPVPVRSIIGANETNGNFRFHQVRDGEQWHSDDLDKFLYDKIVIVDSRPPA